MSVSNYAVRKIMKNSDFIKYMIEDRKNTEKELNELKIKYENKKNMIEN